MRRVIGCSGLTVLCLLYLQFGFHALFNFVPQGVLTVVAAIALARGAFRVARRAPAALLVSVGTAPLALLHAVMTLIEPGELPFLIISLPVPVAALLAWLRGRRRPAYLVA